MHAVHALANPIGHWARPHPGLDPQDSLGRAAFLLNSFSAGVLPVTECGVLIGQVSHATLMRALASGRSESDPVRDVMEEPRDVVVAHESAAEALRTAERLGVASLIVVDPRGFVVGVAYLPDLLAPSAAMPRPPMAGGMATPFGVYLTTGGVSGGVRWWAVCSTGALLFVMFFLVVLVCNGLAEWVWRQTNNATLAFWIRDFGPFPLFLLAMRALPISGIHAAEHMVVHAIERGEPLEIEAVRRMPRVHPRCGTNVAVAAGLFLGLAGWEWTRYEELRLLAAVVATLLLWRPLGNLLQFLATTKPPTDKQLLAGIAAGRELLANYALARGRRPSLPTRIARSGMLHVLAGSLAAFLVIQALCWLLGLRFPI